MRENSAFFVRALLAVLFCKAYFLIGFYPLNWQLWLPETLENNAVLHAEGASFEAPGIAHTRHAPDWLNNPAQITSLRIALQVQSYSLNQTGPARILTVSTDPSYRNLTIGQEGSDLVIRLRSQLTDLNGMPSYLVTGVFAAAGWRDIDLVIEDGVLNVLIDDEIKLNSVLPAGSIATWSEEYKLALGNELLGNRAWVGAIKEAIVSVDGKTFNYLAPKALYLPQSLAIPEKYRELPSIQLFPLARGETTLSIVLQDVTLNFFGFAVLGFFILMMVNQRMAGFAVTLLCAAVSVIIETGQLFLPTRITALSDLVLNTTGAATGAWCAGYILKLCHWKNFLKNSGSAKTNGL